MTTKASSEESSCEASYEASCEAFCFRCFFKYEQMYRDNKTSDILLYAQSRVIAIKEK